jgi:signal transduction histidine kinase
MDVLSPTTIIVVIGNSISAVVAAAMLMLVLWQNPRCRPNQIFALAMLVLVAYSVLNGLGRFMEPLRIDARIMTYIQIMTYGLFIVLNFVFATSFANDRSFSAHLMQIIGVALVVIQTSALWSDLITTNIHPSPKHDGSYTQEFTLFGQIAGFTMTAYSLLTGLILRRMKNPRGRALWLGPILVVCGTASVIVIWPLVHIPLNAVLLAAAAIALGLPVLRYETFYPEAIVNQELEHNKIELERTSQMKTQFLTNMSVELRTPLNSIIGYTELIVNNTYGPLNDTQRDRLEKVIRNGYNLLSLINDVLDLNRIETGKVVLERRTVPTAYLLDAVLTTIEPMATQKGLTLTRSYRDAPPIYADEVRARQIITNITANAIKFTHEGSIQVRAFRQEGMVQFEIEDTGIGIKPEDHDKVFAEFQQVDNSTTRRYEGTGLGMAITKKLVELHGGQIWLKSEWGKGTTFFVTMPAADPIKTSTLPVLELEQAS